MKTIAVARNASNQTPRRLASSCWIIGQFRLRFDSSPGTRFSVLASTNLADWNPLGPAAELSPGHFEFTDADAPGHPTRFYRLRTP